MRSTLVAFLHLVAAVPGAAAAAPTVVDYARAGLPVFTARRGGLQLNGKRLTLKGLSWFGFEGNNAVVDGLWQRPIDAYMEFIVANRFNALRIPLACNPFAQPDASRLPVDRRAEPGGDGHADIADARGGARRLSRATCAAGRASARQRCLA